MASNIADNEAEALFSSEFGQRLRYYRKLCNLTIDELATLMSTNTSQIWRLEGKGANPKLATIQKLCLILDVPIGKLLPSNYTKSNEDEAYVEFYKSCPDDLKEKIRTLSKMF